jgi:hypothetical protein
VQQIERDGFQRWQFIYIYDVKISGFTRSSIYIYISRLRVNVSIHVRVWLASPPRGARLGYTSICMYMIGQSPARDTPHTDEFD